MGFWAGTYGLISCHDFLKLFLKIEKQISFMGIYFVSIDPQEQKLCPNKIKTKERGQQKRFEILKKKFLNYFFS